MDNHHGDGRLALWCNAPPGAQESLVHAGHPWLFKPPYVGTRGWIGVRLDRPDSQAGEVDWDEIADLIEMAYRASAPKRLLDRLVRLDAPPSEAAIDSSGSG